MIQNFCVKVGTDSRQETRICTRRKDGILTAEFYVRENGGILKSVSVIAHTRGDGLLEIEVWDPDHNIIYSALTSR